MSPQTVTVRRLRRARLDRAARLSGAAGLTAVAALVAGCGSPAGNGEAGKAATQIYSDAKAATAGLPSLRLTGTVVQGEQSIALDIAAGRTTGGGAVTINGSTLSLVRSSGSLYLRAGQAAWTTLTGSKATAAVLANKWLMTTTADQQFGSLTNLVNVSQLVGSFAPQGTLTKTGATSFHGHPAVGLNDAGGNQGTLYVATTGKPYFLGVSGDGQGTIVFDQYGSASIPAVPSGSLSLAKVEQQAAG